LAFVDKTLISGLMSSTYSKKYPKNSRRHNVVIQIV